VTQIHCPVLSCDSTRLQDKDSGKYLKQHTFASISSLQVDANDARSVRLAVPSATASSASANAAAATQELVLQTSTRDERWQLYHLIANLRGAQRQQGAARLRWAHFERALRQADFSVLNGIPFHRPLPSFEALIATLTARIEREVDSLSALERAGLKLQRAGLLYRQGTHLLRPAPIG